MSELKRILMRRDNLTSAEADKRIAEVRDRIGSGEIGICEMDDIMLDEFGLEPDYLMDLLDI
jgi:hypothetical protein